MHFRDRSTLRKMNALVEGKCILNYMHPKSGKVERTRKVGQATVVYEQASSRIVIDDGMQELYLPVRPRALHASLAHPPSANITVRCVQPAIMLMVATENRARATLFVACVTERRCARADEVKSVRAVERQAQEQAAGADRLNELDLLGGILSKAGGAASSTGTSRASRAASSSGGPIGATSFHSMLDAATRRPAATGGTVAGNGSLPAAASGSVSAEGLDTSQLTDEQSAVVQAAAAGRSVFFTGSAGTGKSLVLKHLRAILPASTTAYTATTGVAAVNVGGTTLHAWSGLGGAALKLIEDCTLSAARTASLGLSSSGAEGSISQSLWPPGEEDAASVASGSTRGGRPGSVMSTGTSASQGGGPPKTAGAVHAQALAQIIASVRGKREAVNRWRSTRTLVCDEVSMLDGDTLDVLDAVGRNVRGVYNRPFGGLQLILSGDFFQLPPVGKGPNGGGKKYAFQAQCWSAAVPVCIELTQVFRQSDMSFVDLLNEARWGRVSDAQVRMLNDRWAAPIGTAATRAAGIVATKLHTHRADVDKENSDELSKLAGECRTYKATDSAVGGPRADSNQALLETSCPAPRELQLKVGAQVMLVKSLDIAKGLVNGSRGVVTGFADGAAGKVGSAAAAGGHPIVRFVCGEEMVCRPETWTVNVGGAPVASRRQIPLALAWAISIHKSQGMSLDLVQMDLSRCFEAGQAYVGLSRARSLEGLSLTQQFNPRVLYASDAVKVFYSDMKVKQAAELAADKLKGKPQGSKAAASSGAAERDVSRAAASQAVPSLSQRSTSTTTAGVSSSGSLAPPSGPHNDDCSSLATPVGALGSQATAASPTDFSSLDLLSARPRPIPAPAPVPVPLLVQPHATATDSAASTTVADRARVLAAQEEDFFVESTPAATPTVEPVPSMPSIAAVGAVASKATSFPMPMGPPSRTVFSGMAGTQAVKPSSFGGFFASRSNPSQVAPSQVQLPSAVLVPACTVAVSVGDDLFAAARAVFAPISTATVQPAPCTNTDAVASSPSSESADQRLTGADVLPQTARGSNCKRGRSKAVPGETLSSPYLSPRRSSSGPLSSVPVNVSSPAAASSGKGAESSSGLGMVRVESRPAPGSASSMASGSVCSPAAKASYGKTRARTSQGGAESATLRGSASGAAGIWVASEGL